MNRLTEWLAEHRLFTVVLALGAIVGLVVAIRSSEPAAEPNPGPPPESDMPTWAVILLALSIFALLFAALAWSQWREANVWTDADRRRDRIHKLSTSLTQALTDIAAIEREIEQGTRLLEQLETETETKTRLAELSDAEAAAVRDLVQGAVRRETARGTWVSVSAAVVLFFAGVGVTLLLQG